MSSWRSELWQARLINGAMHRHHLTNRGLAQTLRVGTGTIGRWRTAAESVPPYQLRALAGSLDVPEPELRVAVEHSKILVKLGEKIRELVEAAEVMSLPAEHVLSSEFLQLWNGIDSRGPSDAELNENVGRVSEEIAYFIGSCDAEDRFAERRVTHTGNPPMRYARIAPGQIGDPPVGADGDWFEKMAYTWKARSRSSGAPIRLTPSLRCTQIDQSESGRPVHRYHVRVEFEAVPPNDVVEWEVSGPWPGLWHDLRSDSRKDAGELFFVSPVEILRNTVEVITADRQLANLVLVPTHPRSGVVEEHTEDGKRFLRWRLDGPVRGRITWDVVRPPYR